METEVKLHCIRGRGSTTAVALNFFLPFLYEFGNSELFELYFIFLHGTTKAAETVQFTSITLGVPWNYMQMIGRIR